MQLLFSGAIPGRHDPRGVAAVLGILDLVSGEVLHTFTYATPPDHRAPGQKMQFTGYSFLGDRLFVCAHNEIVIFDEWPPRKPAQILSQPGFNDLHHCIPWQEGLAVANTGLESVDYVDMNGQLLRRWDMLRGTEGARVIDPSTDYRLLPDTKPHLRHPNHLFALNGALWVTQLRTGDAVSVDNPERRIDLQVGLPHDGDWWGEDLVFTTVNGHLVFVEEGAADKVTAYNLLPMTPDLNQLGWCRGACPHPSENRKAIVAFSKVRRTRWKEFGFRLKHGHDVPPGRICIYNLDARRLERTYFPTSDPGYVFFQIEILPKERWI